MLAYPGCRSDISCDVCDAEQQFFSCSTQSHFLPPLSFPCPSFAAPNTHFAIHPFCILSHLARAFSSVGGPPASSPSPARTTHSVSQLFNDRRHSGVGSERPESGSKPSVPGNSSHPSDTSPATDLIRDQVRINLAILNDPPPIAEPSFASARWTCPLSSEICQRCSTMQDADGLWWWEGCKIALYLPYARIMLQATTVAARRSKSSSRID